MWRRHVFKPQQQGTTRNEQSKEPPASLQTEQRTRRKLVCVASAIFLQLNLQQQGELVNEMPASALYSISVVITERTRNEIRAASVRKPNREHAENSCVWLPPFFYN